MKMKYMPLALAVAASLVGVSSASAANWDPQGTAVTGTQVGSGTLTTGGSTVTCATGDTNLTASGATASTSVTTNPVSFGTCTNSLIGGTTHVTTTGTWSFHAVDTTNVTATATSTSGFVAEIIVQGAVCVRVPSPVTITGNDWNNTTHRLVTNSSASFASHPVGLCAAVAPTTSTLATTFQLPSNVIIT